MMETERLIIDPLREGDREDYFFCISHDKKVLETFICRYAETLWDFDFSVYLNNKTLYAIRLKATGRLIGIILYFGEQGAACEIGYGLGSGYWGQGYATEAVKRFIAFCMEEKGFQTVYASFFTGNEASRRVMEKCGMRYSRFSEKELSYLGAERDLTYYAVTNRSALRSDLLLLNGPSSAGKSSVARALKKELDSRGVDAAVLSIDDYLAMSPDAPIWEDDVFAVMESMGRDVSQALGQQKLVIADHVITSERIYRALLDAAAGYRVKTALLSCGAETLRQREAARGDRFPGSAEASLQYLYPREGYDLWIDTEKTASGEAAAMLLDMLFKGKPSLS